MRSMYGYEDHRQLLDMPDEISSTFELGPDAHHAWVANAKAQPEDEEDEEECASSRSGRRVCGQRFME